MTLKERFQQWFINDEEDEHYEGMVEAVSIEHERVADEFAIGFAEFSINYNYHPIHKVWIKYDKMANEKFTTKKLLEIYKKEKEL